MEFIKLLEKILAALEENTATLKALSGKTAAAAGKSETTANAKPASKPAVKDEDEDDKPKRGPGRPPKAKVLTPTEMGEKAREFAESAGDDEDDFKARRKHLVKIAEKFGADKFSAIKGDDQKAALKMLEDYENGDEGDEEAGDY